ncbi:hypothetical protein ACJ73_04154 [Blastomyces percursus]|uniref:CCHC-type domain-containing protein n=1 Tax=Blastomyces percursus TaxID=1658174 RepID=A0A1J9Q6W6_9EURO|nr:hypothetical protein ACJ73_04154 [Blastomyces percursus]
MSEGLGPQESKPSRTAEASISPPVTSSISTPRTAIRQARIPATDNTLFPFRRFRESTVERTIDSSSDSESQSNDESEPSPIVQRQSLSRWLVKLEWELRASKVGRVVPAEELLPAINLLLTGEAEEWIQANPSLMRLLESPTEDNRVTFMEAFKDQFPEETLEEKVSCEAEMDKLVQGEAGLTEYYQLGVKVLRRLGIKDQIAATPAMGRKAEILLLETFIRKWIRGLNKTRTRTKLIEVANELPTLSAAYHKALNIEKAEQELKKDKQAREREKEIVWLRKCFEQTLDPNRFSEFKAAYAKQVQGVEEEDEWEIPEGLRREAEPTRPVRSRTENTNTRKGERPIVPAESLPEGPEGQKSSNEFVNGTRQFRKDGPSPLCIECGRIGHISKACTGPALEAWEKTILKEKVFGPPGAYVKPQRGKASGQGVSQVEALRTRKRRSQRSKVNLGEGSRPNKRAASITRGAAQKRREVTEEEDSHTIPPEDPSIVGAKPKATRKRTGLALLKGFAQAEDPDNKPRSTREIFDSFKAEINLTDLLQYSPFLVASLKKFMTRESTGRGRRKNPQVQALEAEGPGVNSQAVTVAADVNTRLLSQLKPEDKAFRIPAQIKIAGQVIDLPRAVTQADQGSELNLVTEAFLKTYMIAKKPLGDIGYQGMSMRTATKVESLLHFWAEVNVGVEGIWRKVPCFVSSSPKTTTLASNDLLLGIPWLFDVNARMDIRRGSLIIGDSEKQEPRVIVQGPELVFTRGTKILMLPPRLLPEGRKGKARYEPIEDDPIESEESDGEESGYEEEIYQDSSEDEEPGSSEKDF